MARAPLEQPSAVNCKGNFTWATQSDCSKGKGEGNFVDTVCTQKDSPSFSIFLTVSRNQKKSKKQKSQRTLATIA
jgi:hypothetical protein